jgi:hypothetical protein
VLTCVALCSCLASGDAACEPSSGQAFGVGTAVPQPRARLESAKHVALAREALALETYALSEPAMTEPVASVDEFGAKGDGASDDTDAIQRAIHSLRQGGTVRFTPGKTYLKRGRIDVDRADVKLWGYEARVYSVVTDAQVKQKGAAHLGVQLLAPRTALYGLTLASNLRKRPPGHPHANGVHVASEDQQVIDCRFEYAGIFVRKARRFVIARNVVYRSTADGIHVTTGSSDGLVAGNLVRETGDDMIAVVNYGLGEPSVGNVLIERNDVSGQYWGRGIAIVGGRNITVRRNQIARTPFGAGILVHSETSYRTANVRGVRVEENEIREVQTRAPDYDPTRKKKRTGHGAIDVHGQGAQHVSGVTIRKNVIEGTAKDGVTVRGNACDIQISDNELRRIGRRAIHVDAARAPSCAIACAGNRLGSALIANEQCAPAAGFQPGADGNSWLGAR